MSRAKKFDNARKTRLGKLRVPAWFKNAPLWLLVFVMALMLLLATVYGASKSGDGPEPSPTTTPSQIYEAEPEPNPNMVEAPDQPEILKAIAAIEESGKMEVGVAISAIGTVETRPQDTWSGGTIVSGPAWATATIPAAIAILDEAKQPEDRKYMFEKSFVEGSPAGDDALWAYLGTHDQAVSKTLRILHRYGDWGTAIPSEEEAESHPYRQVLWPLKNQSEFMAEVQCDWVHTVPVMAKMDEPTNSPIGLQTIPRSFSKSGDGTKDGVFSLRQTGLIDLQDGTPVAVTIMVNNKTGDKEATRDALTTLAKTVASQAKGFARPSC